ncbi:hypothetical protein [Streptomyces sp. CBMA152]|uniref:hypothetical protein n=1 Tax=Streptomyces sp. CBMA152 TaxID=1896312 RepID=UPI0016617F38|nr:hypothetical protein [Streptomyces sp. CBMA152]MBD0746669.1 hypothetical protein [Streptomyces sp. CBMA152]
MLFPTVTQDATPAVLDDDRALDEGDFFSAKTEDRYPDVFELLPVGADQDTDHVAAFLAEHPHTC